MGHPSDEETTATCLTAGKQSSEKAMSTYGAHLCTYTESKSSTCLNSKPDLLNMKELLSDVRYLINIASGCDLCFIRPSVY